MAIDKRINLTINTGDAKTQLESIKKQLAGIDSSMPDKKSAPFDGVSTSSKTARKALIDYSGALTNSNRIVIQSSNYATLAEKSLLQQDTALRKLNKAYEEGKIDAAAYDSAVKTVNSRSNDATSQLNSLTTATGKSVAGFKVMRGGLSQISYQLQDVAVQAQMGTSWFTIIGQQGPQIASILGPLGAVLGIVVAVGAAVGGVLYNSLNSAGDSADNLTDSFDAVNKVFKETKSGAISLTGDFKDMISTSDRLAKIKFATALFESSKIVETSGKTIKNTFNDVSQSFGGAIGVDFSDVISQMDKLKNSGISADTALKGTAAVIDEMNKKKPTGVEAFSYEMVKFNGDVDSAVDTASDFSDNIQDLSKKLGLSAGETKSFLQSVDGLAKAKTPEEVDSISSSLSEFALQIAQSTDKTYKQKESVISLANSYVEFAGKLSTALKVVQTGSEVGGAPVSFSKAFTEGQEAAAGMVTAFSKAGQTSKSINDAIIAINEDYERLNKLQKENQNISIDDAREAAQRNSMGIIADTIAEYDKYSDRVKIVNELIAKTPTLTEENRDAILALANEQNKVYEKQISFNNTLQENAAITSGLFADGAKDYAKSVGTYNSSLQSLVTSTFSSMEDYIVEWAETGKASFTDFVNSAISDLLRLMVQQQLAGLASGIAGAFGGSSASASTDYFSTSGAASSGSVGIGTITASAKGNALTKYANGGVTGMANTIQSTPKYFANGSGLLGEAGSEAIVPLTRTSGGDLGIKSVGGGSPVINYNVTNEAGIESTETQSTNSDGSIDINVINKLVSKSIASGYADKAITNRFNTSKKGK